MSLPVPLFSFKELPVKEPATLTAYSIGEEISASIPLAISWSPPGLAKHRRCALAALTANLVLAIWAANGTPQEESNWRRRIIVNDALTEYFINNATDESSHLTSDPRAQMRLRTRVRAFTWAPAMPSSQSPGIIGTRLSYGQHLLAVSNDDNQIAFVVIDSPTSTLGKEQTWRAEVLTHLSLIPDSESIFLGPTSFEDMMNQQRHVSHVSWSPWVIRGDWYHSVIVYAMNEDVRARIVTYAHDSIGFGDEVIYSNIELRFNGLMKWSSRVEEGDQLILALFTTSGLVCLKISAHDASELGRTSHDLDGRWDQVSGAVWDSTSQSPLQLHLCSLLSTLYNPTAVVEMSSDGFNNLPSPLWKDQIENNLALFSVQNDLKGNSKTKVWGLTSSPLGDFILACNSVHPSDMIEYGPPAERRGTIAISALRQYRELRQSFPTRNVSAEGVLFTLTKLADNTVETANEIPAFVDDIVEKLIRAYTPLPALRSDHEVPATYSDPTNLDILVIEFKKATFMNPHTLKDRYTILVSQACKATLTTDLNRTLIAYRLAAALNDLPSSLLKTSFSKEIHALHHQLVALINTLIGPDLGGSETSTDDALPTNSSDMLNATNTTTSGINVSNMYLDKCDLCHAPVPFTDLTSAACANGHQFPRCGLSFVAIQAPGITKYCGVCNTPFLNEEFVAAQEKEIWPRSTNEDMDATTGIERSGTEVMIPDRQNEAPGGYVDVVGGDEGVTIATEQGNTISEQPQQNEVENPKVDDRDAAPEEEQAEPPITLARVLFLACDVCIYCGGRFVG